MRLINKGETEKVLGRILYFDDGEGEEIEEMKDKPSTTLFIDIDYPEDTQLTPEILAEEFTQDENFEYDQCTLMAYAYLKVDPMEQGILKIPAWALNIEGVVDIGVIEYQDNLYLMLSFDIND